VPVTPLLPGLADSISSTGGGSLNLSPGISNLYSFDWLFGFVTSIFLYTVLSKVFPARETLLNDTIWNLDTIEGVREGGSDEEKGSGGEKGDGIVDGDGTYVHQKRRESDGKPF
jgi:nucleobase:cation symporter-1, NCS1 family